MKALWTLPLLIALGSSGLACKASVQAGGAASGHASGQGQGQATPGEPTPAEPTPGEPTPGEPAAAPVEPGAPTAGATGGAGTCPNVTGNRESVSMPAGTFECDVQVLGNRNSVSGAGHGQTIIKGALHVSGNRNQVSGMSVENKSDVSGNRNDVSGVDFRGGVSVTGSDNVQ